MWKKYFQEVPSERKLEKWINSQNSSAFVGSRQNHQSWLPEVYAGPPNRLERYRQYEIMDRDAMISVSLDTIAEFCTQMEEKSNMYFEFNFKDEASEPEIEILDQKLNEWTEINDFDKRLWRIVRSTLVYGDQFFVRDPETYRWLWIDPYNVEQVVVNEAQGKKPEEYWVRDPDLNLQTLAVSKPSTPAGSGNYGYPAAWAGRTPPGAAPSKASQGGYGQTSPDSMAIDATHIIHLSLSEGLDNNWPFGNSILEPVFKVYKQKSFLEDAILIYRVHRAPERRVFYIDTGNLPPHKQMAHMERVKNEINQRRIPTRSGGNENILDATYNPMSLTEDYYFPQHADGRGSRVETLPGGENLGQINDLDYFNNLLKQGLNVPSAYIPGASEDDTATYSDGRATTALISELRFTNYCKRIQSWLNDNFDREFKLYLKQQGVTIEADLFQLTLNIPQNFAKYRQIELDNAMISTWSQISEVPYISKRFAMKRWLGMSEDEIVENERMWKEENEDKLDSDTQEAGGVDDLRSLGIRPGGPGGADLGLEGLGDDELVDQEGGLESPISGAENTGEPPPPPPPPA